MPPSSELHPVVCRLLEELTERINRGEPIDFRKVLDANPEHAEQLGQVLPALQLFCEVGHSEVIHVFSAQAAPSPAGPNDLTVDDVRVRGRRRNGEPNEAGGTTSLNDLHVEQTLGDFRLLRQIGKGGMGIVYEAEQISLGRRVAVKVLPFAGVLDDRQLQRFKNEARAAAGLTHPNIVPVYAVGSERGIHYYAMQYIDGPTLAQVVHGSINVLRDSSVVRGSLTPHRTQTEGLPTHSQRRLTNGDVESPTSSERAQSDKPRALVAKTLNSGTTDPTTNHSANPTARMSQGSTIPDGVRRYRVIAEWGAQIAEALDYAHSVGVVHRDIKPANLMVDAQGNVWITDFGLAQFELGTGLTMTGDLLGTLRYMSPEQAVGEKGLLDQRTDVYSLGATLYELLAKQPVFGEPDRTVLLYKILHDDPVSLTVIDPLIPRDLATIIHKALERDLATRYATANDMAADLRRFLEERPIRAKPPTAIDRARKWATRNSTLVRLVAAFTFLVAFALTGMVLIIKHERAQAELAKRAQKLELDQAELATRSVRIHSYVTHVNLAGHAMRTGQTNEARRQLELCRPNPDEEDLRGWEWQYLWNSVGNAPAIMGRHNGDAYCSSMAPDGKFLATGGQDGVRIWDLASGEPRRHLKEHSSEVNGVCYSVDGKLLATASDDQTVKIWDTVVWRCIHTIPHKGPVVSAVFSPDSRLLATGERAPAGDSRKNIVRFWDTRDWEHIGEDLTGHVSEIESVNFNGDGSLLATCSGDGTACIWDVEARKLRHRIAHRADDNDKTSVTCVAFARRHPLLATVGSGTFLGNVRLWNIESGNFVGALRGAEQNVQGVDFSPDDSLVAASGNENLISAWRIQPDGTVAESETLQTTSRTWSVNFINDTEIVSTGRDGTVSRRPLFVRPLEKRIPCPKNKLAEIVFHPDGRSLFVANDGLELHSFSAGVPPKRIDSSDRGTNLVALSQNRRMIADASVEGRISLRDLKGDVLHRTKILNYQVIGLEFFENDRLLCAMTNGGPSKYVFFDTGSATPMSSQIPRVNATANIEFSPDGQTMCVVPGNGHLELWRNGNRLWFVDNVGALQNGVVFSMDGAQVATCSSDGTIRVWNTADPKMSIAFADALTRRANLGFSADGKTLGGFFGDGVVKLWNIATGRELLTLDSKLSSTWMFKVSPFGNALAVSGSNSKNEGEIVVWHFENEESH